MADLQRTVSVIFEGQDKMSGAVSGIEKSLSGVETAAGSASGQIGKLDDELEKVGGSETSINKATAALKALAASLVLKAFIDANVEAEKFEKTMTLLKGSSAAAAEEFDYIKDVSNRLGLELTSTADAYVQLTAATRGTGLEGAATRDIFEAVSKAMASLGKSSDDTQGALLAISQIVSKGTVSLEELRGQLGERLPGAFQIAAQSMGLTTQELDSLVSSGKLTAEEFLPKFAAALDDAFDGAKFDGYTASLNRLKNGINESFVLIGEAGAFNILTKGVEAAGTGTAALAGTLEYLGSVYSATRRLFDTGSWEDFERDLRQIETQFNLTTDAITGTVNESAAETARLARQAAEAGERLGTEVVKSAELSGEAWAKASADIDKALKTLGIDPKIFKDPLDGMEAAFTSLVKNAVSTGEQVVVGLTGALQKLPQDASLDEFRRQIAYAFRDGKISAEEYAQALALIDVKQSGLAPSFGPVSDAVRAQSDELAKNAKEAEKAEEATRRYALELEKLASNERIANIEARVTLNVAQVEAETQRIEALFASLNTSISSTGDVIDAALGSLKDITPNTAAFDLIERQLDVENQRRQEAFDLQRKLTEAQIKEIAARTQAMQQGEGIIKIDGAGLQPHLEAFMWEILKTIQVRVNADGLSMLLGLP